MKWFGLPITLCGLGLPGPALLSLAAICVMRCLRDFGPFETIYIGAFVGLGYLAG